MYKKMKNNDAFTLMELIIVMAVIAILIALAIPQFGKFKQRALVTRIQNDSKVLQTAVTTDSMSGKDFFQNESIVSNLDEAIENNQVFKNGKLLKNKNNIGGELYELNEDYIKSAMKTSLEGDFLIDKAYNIIYISTVKFTIDIDVDNESFDESSGNGIDIDIGTGGQNSGLSSEEREKLEKEKQKLQNELNQKNKDNQNLNDRIKELNRIIEDLKNNNDTSSLEAKIRELESQLNSSNSNNTKLLAEIDRLQNIIDSMDSSSSNTIKELQEKLDELKSQLQNVEKDKDNALIKNKEIQDELDKLRENEQANKDKIAQLEKEARENESKLNDANNKSKELEDKIRELESDKTSKEDVIKELEDKVEELEAQKVDPDRIKELEDIIKELEDRLNIGSIDFESGDLKLTTNSVRRNNVGLIDKNNYIYMNGFGSNYALGNSSTSSSHGKFSRVSVLGTDNKQIKIKDAKHGEYFTIARTVDNELYSWGGQAQAYSGRTSDKRVPGKIVFPDGDIKIKEYAVGYKHTLALGENGKVYSWGDGGNGCLGHGDISSVRTPKEIEFFSNLRGVEIVNVFATYRSSFALDSHGNVWAWGNNSSGKLGLGDNNDEYTPVIVDYFNTNHIKVIDIIGTEYYYKSSYGYGTIFLTDTGKVYFSGSNLTVPVQNTNSTTIPTLLDTEDMVVRDLQWLHLNNEAQKMLLAIDDDNNLWSNYSSGITDYLINGESKVRTWNKVTHVMGLHEGPYDQESYVLEEAPKFKQVSYGPKRIVALSEDDRLFISGTTSSGTFFYNNDKYKQLRRNADDYYLYEVRPEDVVDFMR